uniref:DNA-directed DNA polymerase n=1 Tax=Arcella intermedia TaxID=1963864 RepID=A0A6B2L123_9EUKA
MDFTSLYPSIMMAHNLCYTTLLSPAIAATMSPDEYSETPNGDKFVKREIQQGILPSILEDLLNARRNVKKLMENEKDPMRYKVYNARQLALKISANSVYGFTGQARGALPCVEISASVTAYGRLMIKTTKEALESEYTLKNGYPADAEVIYGDTDSVMVNFGVNTIEEAIKLGKEAARFVSSKFPKPINLDFEKVYFPWLLISKKRYAGLWWTKPDKWDKMDAKGIESVRRDNCGLVRHMIDKILNKILIDKDVDGAIDYTKGVISDLLQNKVDLSLLIITKSLTKSQDKYTAPQAHAVLAERMRKRDPATAPQIGDRIPYVIVRGDKEAKTYEKAEEPIYVLDHGLAVDAQYYLENQLAKPVCRIFKSILPNPEATLLAGGHTRQISRPTPKSGGIVGFTRRKETCMGCRAPLPEGKTILCDTCTEEAPAVYQTFLNKVKVKEREFSRLWTQCQSCQGSMHQEVLCTAKDCPIYYLRTKVQKEFDEARESLERFNSISW